MNSTAKSERCSVTINEPSIEAYIDHLWDVDDLTVLSRIMVLNMDVLDSMERGFGWILQIFRMLDHAAKHNSQKGSKRNIIAHFDLGNELYRSFLDPAMMYSSAIYPKESSSLEEASKHKLETICKRLDLKPTIRKHGYDERFRRLWEYYHCYCEGGFQERSISVVHVVASRPTNGTSLVNV